MDINKICKKTQEMYLKAAALYPDSHLNIDEKISYVTSVSGQGRWANAVVDLNTFEDEIDSELKLLMNSYVKFGINFNWQSWSINPNFKKINASLNEKGFKYLGELQCLYHGLKQSNPTHTELQFEYVNQENYLDFLSAKIKGWHCPKDLQNELDYLIRAELEDHRHWCFLIKTNGSHCGAGNMFVDSKWAYLRGDCVIPECRGKGYYKDFIHFRLEELTNSGYEHAVTIADSGTSAPIFKKCGFEFISKIDLWALQAGPWVTP